MVTKVHNRMIANTAIHVMDFGAVGDGVADDTSALEAVLNKIYYDNNSQTGLEAARINQVKIVFPAGRTFRVTRPLVIGNTNVHPDPSWCLNLQIEGNGATIQGDLPNASDYTFSIYKAAYLHIDGLTVMSKTSEALYLDTIAHSRFNGMSLGSTGRTPLTLRGYIYNCKFTTTRIGSLAGLTGGVPGIDANMTAAPQLHAFRGCRIVSFEGLYISGCDRAMEFIGDTSTDAQGVLNEGVTFRDCDWEANSNTSVALIQYGKRFVFDSVWNEGASVVGTNKALNLLFTDSVEIKNTRSGAHYHKISLQDTFRTTISNVSDGAVILEGTNDSLSITNCSFKLNNTREFLQNLFVVGHPKYNSINNFNMTNVAIHDINTSIREDILTSFRSNAFVKNDYIVTPTGLTNATFLRLIKAAGTGTSPLGLPVVDVTANTTTTARQSITFDLDLTDFPAGYTGTGVLLVAMKWNPKVGATLMTDVGSLSSGTFGNGLADMNIYQDDWIIFPQRINLSSSTVIELVFNNQTPIPINTTFEFGGAILYAGNDIIIPQGIKL